MLERIIQRSTPATARRRCGSTRSADQPTLRLTFRTGAATSTGASRRRGGPTRPILDDKSVSSAINRPRLRPLLHGLAPAHGRAARQRRDLLGREHAARLALERDDARDRARVCGRCTGKLARAVKPKIGIFGAGWVGLVTGACFAELGHEVVVRDVVPERIEALQARRGAVPRAGRRGAARAQPRAADASRSTSTTRSTAPVPLRLRRHAADLLRRRRPLARSGRSSTSCRALEERRVARDEEHRARSAPARRCARALDARGLAHVGYVSNPEFLAEGSAVRDFMDPTASSSARSPRPTATRSPRSTTPLERAGRATPTSPRPR